jgi:hypothetical protein
MNIADSSKRIGSRDLDDLGDQAARLFRGLRLIGHVTLKKVTVTVSALTAVCSQWCTSQQKSFFAFA